MLGRDGNLEKMKYIMAYARRMTVVKNFIQQKKMRQGNLLAILQAVANGIRSKRQLQSALGLSWGTISGGMASLVENRLLLSREGWPEDYPSSREVDIAQKHSSCYFFPSDSNLIIGLEILPAVINCILRTADGKILGRGARQDCKFRTALELGEQMESCCAEILKKAGVTQDAVSAIAVALTGAVDNRHQMWLKTSHIPVVHEWSFGDMTKAFANPAKVVFQHDIIAKAQSVTTALPRMPQNYVFLHIGEGIGMAINHHGRFFTGYRGFSGEIGHIFYDGQKELEDIVSLRGLREFAASHGKTFTGQVADSEKEFYFDFLRPGLFKIIQITANLFDPEMVFIGGEALEPFEDMVGPFAEEAAQKCWMNGPARISFYPMGQCNTAEGAALGIIDQVLKEIACSLDVMRH